MTIPRLTPYLSQVAPAGIHTNGRSPAHVAMRRYRALWQARDKGLREREQTAPALPLFDAAHSAFARGTLITTPRGPVAIEDLLPGDTVMTAEHGPLPILWIGSVVLRSDAEAATQPTRLTRIMADAFGVGRPMTDLLTGPGARILTRPRGLRASIGADHVMTPTHAIADGTHAFRLTPPGPVRLYHLCLRHHATIKANGLETESFHPGVGFEREVGPKMLNLFLGLFPHIREPHQFGPLAHLRLPLNAPDSLNVA